MSGGEKAEVSVRISFLARPPSLSPPPSRMVVMNAFDVGNCEIRICKQTALAECVVRLRERFQVLLVSGLQKNEIFRPERKTSSGFQVVCGCDELLLF